MTVRNRSGQALVVSAATLAFALAAGRAEAQVLQRFALRGEAGAGIMLPELQRAQLGYDGAHLQLTGRLGFNLTDWLSLQGSVNNGFFFVSAQSGLGGGRVLAVQGGLRIEPRLGSLGRLWLDGNVGHVSTGEERRLGFDAGLGFEFALAPWLGVGPSARFHLVKHDPEANAPSNATYLSFGLSFTLRAPPEAPPPLSPLDTDGDGVLDPDDQCVTVPRGANPDPGRLGCPRPDADGDGVYDDEDQCVQVPAGPTPDPARRGCPRPDADGDGVYDDEDQCVQVPAGPTPDAARRGCPDGDDDNDGVRNGLDQCRAVSSGLYPDPARLGCPLPDRDRDSVPEPPDACPDQPGAPSTDPQRNGCPGLVLVQAGLIRINQPVYFATAMDTILPTSDPVLTAVGEAMRAMPGIRRVAIEGHTDDVNDDAANLDLSNRRAASVLRWLTEHGIEATRLEAHGFGETRPVRQIAGLRRRALREARALNRRVEFRIVDPAIAAPTPAVPATPHP
ncbi:MAG: OmpA family protein [Deltaproteobacteria bacterium]|nr:OmpA family protein [Deltaproteobacteria bacterium]